MHEDPQHTSDSQTPAQTQPSSATPADRTSAVQQNSLLRDLLVPISIVIAGMFVGAALYFSGGSSTPGEAVVANEAAPAAEQPSGDIDAYNPVTEDDHIRGNPDAPITIIEYSDFDCPFCSRFHDTMKVVTEKYGDNVSWVYRQFPIEQLHPQAPAVAVASECVADLGGNDAFWQFTDEYFATRGGGDNTPHSTLIPELVTNAGVDQAAFTECFESGEMNANVEEDVNNAVETGGRGTPWSILVAPDGSAYPINGALPINAIEQLIDSILSPE